jgi:sortase A
MKNKTNILLILVLIAGLSLLIYPSLSNYWNSFTQSQVIVDYTKQIEKARCSLQQAKNERIRTMYRARIQKLECAWKEKEIALNSRLQSDILVKHFASGTIEVI